jgi:hypothetical protein
MPYNLPIVRRTFLGMTGAAGLGLAVQTSKAPNASGIKVEKDVVVGKAGTPIFIATSTGRLPEPRSAWHWCTFTGEGLLAGARTLSPAK